MRRWRLIVVRPDGSEYPGRTTFANRRAAQLNGRRLPRGYRFRTEPVESKKRTVSSEAFAEAQRLVADGDREGLAKLASRSVPSRARLAVQRQRARF